MTERGRQWVEANVQGDDYGLGYIPIEHRYLADIVNGARVAGLVCHG